MSSTSKELEEDISPPPGSEGGLNSPLRVMASRGWPEGPELSARIEKLNRSWRSRTDRASTWSSIGESRPTLGRGGELPWLIPREESRRASLILRIGGRHRRRMPIMPQATPIGKATAAPSIAAAVVAGRPRTMASPAPTARIPAISATVASTPSPRIRASPLQLMGHLDLALGANRGAGPRRSSARHTPVAGPGDRPEAVHPSPRHQDGRSGESSVRGSQRTKHAPPSGLLQAESRPPCSRRISAPR